MADDAVLSMAVRDPVRSLAPAAPIAAVTADDGRTRDEAAFAEFYEAELPRLAGWCLRFTGEEQAARDLAQEALVRTWARWVRVTSPKAYAYLVATNLARRAWRRRARELDATGHLTWGVPAEPGGRADRAGGGSTSGMSGTDAVELHDLVARLPERLRAVVVLHHVADLPVEEVARQLRRPVGTVKRRLHEARSLLHSQMEDR